MDLALKIIKMGQKPDFPYTWTIDKSREIFFIPVRSIKKEDSSQLWCIFWWQGTRLTAVLRKYPYFTKVHGQWGVRWQLESIWKPRDFTVENEEIIPVLKEAIQVYGYDGVYRQEENYEVECDF